MAKGRQRGNREIKKPKATKKLGFSNTSTPALRDQIHVRTPTVWQNAASAAVLLITTETLVSELSDKVLDGDRRGHVS
jgi:hypothetical protein